VQLICDAEKSLFLWWLNLQGCSKLFGLHQVGLGVVTLSIRSCYVESPVHADCPSDHISLPNHAEHSRLCMLRCSLDCNRPVSRGTCTLGLVQNKLLCRDFKPEHCQQQSCRGKDTTAMNFLCQTRTLSLAASSHRFPVPRLSVVRLFYNKAERQQWGRSPNRLGFLLSQRTTVVTQPAASSTREQHAGQ
jgi:hypothetical protein